MADSLARDAISFLIDLAERGEIDPWDVNVIDVIDRFLNELSPFSAASREHYEANLSQSGQAFLYASMLLLLKADSLSQEERSVDAEAAIEEMDYLGDQTADLTALPMRLENQLRRRAVARPPQRRRVTLQELIAQLEVIANALDDRNPRKPRRRPRQHTRAQAVRTIAQLAHQENLTEMAIALEEFFLESWQELSQGKDWIDFDLLLEFWIQSKFCQEITLAGSAHVVNPETHERVGVFWALLLLSAQSKVELAQEQFYQDLRVRTLLQLNQLNLDELAALALPD